LSLVFTKDDQTMSQNNVQMKDKHKKAHMKEALSKERKDGLL